MRINVLEGCNRVKILPLVIFFVAWVHSGAAVSKVYYVDLEGNISEKENLLVADHAPIDVVSILDVGTNISEIYKINEKYRGYFNFINPGEVVPVYAIVFSMQSGDEIIDSMISSGRATNELFYNYDYVDNHRDCIIRVIYDENRLVYSFNMFVFDGSYSSYDSCLSEFYETFQSFKYIED